MSLPGSSILEVAWPMLKQPVKQAGALVPPHAAMVPRRQVLHAWTEGRQAEHVM